MGEQSGITLSNCVVSDNWAKFFGGGMMNIACTLSVRNCVFNANTAGTVGGAIANTNGTDAVIINSILWGDTPQELHNLGGTLEVTYSDVQGGSTGLGNIECEPLFADVNNRDYHLKSSAGRWDPNEGSWVYDVNTSRCIDAGSPGFSLDYEPYDVNNLRINMGVYGGTSEASMSPVGWTLLGDLSNDGVVDVFDVGYWMQEWLVSGDSPADLDIDGVVDGYDFAMFADDWLAETAWR